ncbi:hypothetical protein H5410_041722, partial [Solanum commersonii]
VLWNPFEDIVPRAKPAEALPSGVATEKKDAKQKATKKLNLLSFGEEAEEEEKELVTVSSRIRSSHDVLDDPRLLKEGKHDQALDSSEGKSTRDVQLTIREALGSKKEASRKEPEAGFQESLDNSDEDEAGFDSRMRQQILKRRKELGDLPPKQKLLSENGNARNHSPSPSRSDAKHDDQPKVDKLSLKRKGIGSEARAERMANANTDLQLLSGPERERQLLKQKKRGRKGHEEDMLAKLEKFKAGLSAKANESANAIKEEELSDWAAVTLKFTPEPGKDKMSRSEDPNDYVVHDPLLEKGKEKFNKMMAKQKRREREWAGKSLT